jgi:hypothetical protein
MKQSDSATSLTNLVVCDTACYFCNEPADLEKGMPLIDTKKFLNCECRLTTHTKCWIYHLASETGERVVCPLCGTQIAGWKKREASEASEAIIQQREGYKYCSKQTKTCWKIIGCIFVIIVIIATLITLKLQGII